jgi:flavin reductase (DIM6/NTAB) family NADH-FMN oxidoreductase RutF
MTDPISNSFRRRSNDPSDQAGLHAEASRPAMDHIILIGEVSHVKRKDPFTPGRLFRSDRLAPSSTTMVILDSRKQWA